jgi:hypothetical protein
MRKAKMKPICLLLMVVAAACTSRRGTREFSGFLQDYGQLEAEEPRVYAYDSGKDLRGYDALIIDPVKVVLAPGSRAAELGDETLQKVADAFNEILLEEIEPYYSVVDRAAPNVIRIRIAITDIVPLPETDEISDSPLVDVGGASLEAEAVDSVSGERLAAVVRELEGEEGFRAPDRWRYVEGAFRAWARRLSRWIDSKGVGAEEE